MYNYGKAIRTTGMLRYGEKHCILANILVCHVCTVVLRNYTPTPNNKHIYFAHELTLKALSDIILQIFAHPSPSQQRVM